MKYNEFNNYYFDLDRTVWDTIDKYGNPIWARQMIQPYTLLDQDTIIDDCYSICKLQSGIRQYLQLLTDNNKKISFISRGGNLKIKYLSQPSIIILKKFKILSFFNIHNILLHKLEDKHKNIKDISKDTIFFDDSEEELTKMSTIYPKIKCVNRIKDFNSWETLL
jgi:predicted phosphatase